LKAELNFTSSLADCLFMKKSWEKSMIFLSQNPHGHV